VNSGKELHIIDCWWAGSQSNAKLIAVLKIFFRINSQFQQGVMALHPPLLGKTTAACYACMEGIID
jgi:hypothetical protein